MGTNYFYFAMQIKIEFNLSKIYKLGTESHLRMKESIHIKNLVRNNLTNKACGSLGHKWQAA